MHSQNCTQNEPAEVNGQGKAPQTGRKNVVPAPHRPKPSNKQSLRQVLELQDAAHSAGKLLAQDILKTKDPSERAKLVSSLATISNAWTYLQDAKREIRGKGKVKPVEAKQPVQKRTTYEIDETAIAPMVMNDTPIPPA